MDKPPDDRDSQGFTSPDQTEDKKGTSPLNTVPGRARSTTIDSSRRSGVLREVLPDQARPGEDIRLPKQTGRVRLLPRVPNPPPWRIIFHTAGPNPVTIGLDVREPLVLGRADPNLDENPDLDLTIHGAIEHGISRHHAVLVPAPDGLFLIDLDSTNGTWVNGQYLNPEDRHSLKVGDRVELGLLILLVKNLALQSR